MFEITGMIIALLDTKEGTSKTTGNKWMLQQFVIETQEQYPHKALFDVFGEDKIKQFDLHGGEFVKVTFRINSREYNGKWYNSFNVVNVTREEAQKPTFKPSSPTDDLDAIFGTSHDEEEPPF